MASNVLSFSTENTSLVLNGYGFSNYQDGDIIEAAWANPVTTQVRGRKDVNIMKRSDSGVMDLTVRLMRFSNDDVYLNSKKNQELPVIFEGSLTENFISNDGVESVSSYNLGAGSLTDQPTEVINNTDGNFLMEYKLRFNDCIRVI